MKRSPKINSVIIRILKGPHGKSFREDRNNHGKCGSQQGQPWTPINVAIFDGSVIYSISNLRGLGDPYWYLVDKPQFKLDPK